MYAAYASRFIHWQERPDINDDIVDVPVILRIWAANELCTLEELLYMSDPIDNEDWKKLEIEFIPEGNYQYIIFEPFDKLAEGQRANLLIDKISHLKVID